MFHSFTAIDSCLLLTSNVKIRILVVDDEPDILLAMSSIYGAEVIMSKHLIRQRVRKLDIMLAIFDLVIADYRMPGGITGIDLAKIVKKHKVKQSLSDDRFWYILLTWI